MSAPEKRQPPQAVKLVLDLGPLLVFFAVNALTGIYWATGVFMLAIVAALAVSRLFFGHFPVMPLVTAGFVLVFGGLTLWLHDETFIKVKPTVIYALMSGLLVAGMFTGRLFLRTVMGEVFDLDDAGWRRVTWQWALFLLLLAATNELVWRNVSTDNWVAFKVFGLVPLTLLFAVAQSVTLRDHIRAKE